MAILKFRTVTYAKAIYVYGTNRLTARDGFVGVANGYYTAIQEYASITYTKEQLDLALASGWITQEEYDGTMALAPVMA